MYPFERMGGDLIARGRERERERERERLIGIGRGVRGTSKLMNASKEGKRKEKNGRGLLKRWVGR